MKKNSSFPGWTWDKDGVGSAGTYEKDGWTVFCNGTQWLIVKPDGETYAKGYATVGAAVRNAEKIMEKKDRAAYMREYMKQYKAIRIPLRADNEEDQRIGAWLDQQPNKSEYLKSLILDDMETAGK